MRIERSQWRAYLSTVSLDVCCTSPQLHPLHLATSHTAAAPLPQPPRHPPNARAVPPIGGRALRLEPHSARVGRGGSHGMSRLAAQHCQRGVRAGRDGQSAVSTLSQLCHDQGGNKVMHARAPATDRSRGCVTRDILLQVLFDALETLWNSAEVSRGAGSLDALVHARGAVSHDATAHNNTCVRVCARMQTRADMSRTHIHPAAHRCAPLSCAPPSSAASRTLAAVMRGGSSCSSGNPK